MTTAEQQRRGSSRRRRLQCGLSLLFSLITVDGLASAPDDPLDVSASESDGPIDGTGNSVSEARQLFDAGRRAYESGRYDVATRALEASFRLTPRPAIAFSLAQALRKQFFVDRDLRKLKRAIALYRRYLSEEAKGPRREDAVQFLSELEPMLFRLQPEALDREKGTPGQSNEPQETQLMLTSKVPGLRASIAQGELRELPFIVDVAPGTHTIQAEGDGYFPESIEAAAVEGRLVVVDVSLREKPAELEVIGPDGAELFIDGRPQGELPISSNIVVAPGSHRVEVRESGAYPFVDDFVFTRGQRIPITAELETTTQRKLAWSFTAASGATLVATGLLVLLAVNAESSAQELANRPSNGIPLTASDASRQNDLIQTRDRYAGFATASGALGFGLGVTGLILFLTDNPRATK